MRSAVVLMHASRSSLATVRRAPVASALPGCPEFDAADGQAGHQQRDRERHEHPGEPRSSFDRGRCSSDRQPRGPPSGLRYGPCSDGSHVAIEQSPCRHCGAALPPFGRRSLPGSSTSSRSKSPQSCSGPARGSSKASHLSGWSPSRCCIRRWPRTPATAERAKPGFQDGYVRPGADQPARLARRGRCADVALRAVEPDRVVKPVRCPQVHLRVGPVQAREAFCDRRGDLRRGRGTAAHGRRHRNEPRDALGMQGGERRERARAVRAAEPDRLLGLRRVHHGERVGGVRLQRQIVLDRIGDAGVAPVIADDPRKTAGDPTDTRSRSRRPFTVRYGSRSSQSESCGDRPRAR